MSFINTQPLKNSTIMYLYSERDRVNMAPDYQRSGGVWTRQKKQLLIDSIINDYDIPKLYFHRLNKEDSLQFDYSVIDGRQRLEAVFDFIEGKFGLSEDIDYQKDESISLAGLGYNDLAQSHPKVRIKFDSFVLPIVTVEVDDIDLIEDMFSRLNEAVPLNAAEKRNAIGGDMVAAIRSLAVHSFFTKSVAFGNKRAQHKEIAARMLLMETKIKDVGRIVDTKRELLDQMARDYKNDAESHVPEVKSNVEIVLDVMSNKFIQNDPLLRAQGLMVVYYLLFRAAQHADQVGKITRKGLIAFRDALSENRKLAESDFVRSDYELLEFDRLSQQGTNDASSIRARLVTLMNWFDIDSDADRAAGF